MERESLSGDFGHQRFALPWKLRGEARVIGSACSRSRNPLRRPQPETERDEDAEKLYPWQLARGDVRPGAAGGPLDRGDDRPGGQRGDRFRRRARLRPRDRRPGAAGDDVRPARRAAQGDVEGAARQPRRAARPLRPQHRHHQGGRLVRRRRRLRHARLLLRARQGARRPHVPRRGGRRPARQDGRLLRPAHPGAPPRRRGAHQRLQLPGLGLRRKGGLRAARRHAGDHQAGHLHRAW